MIVPTYKFYIFDNLDFAWVELTELNFYDSLYRVVDYITPYIPRMLKGENIELSGNIYKIEVITD